MEWDILSNLPIVVVDKILSYLSTRDLLNLRMVSSSVKEYVDAELTKNREIILNLKRCVSDIVMVMKAFPKPRRIKLISVNEARDCGLSRNIFKASSIDETLLRHESVCELSVVHTESYVGYGLFSEINFLDKAFPFITHLTLRSLKIDYNVLCDCILTWRLTLRSITIKDCVQFRVDLFNNLPINISDIKAHYNWGRSSLNDATAVDFSKYKNLRSLSWKCNYHFFQTSSSISTLNFLNYLCLSIGAPITDKETYNVNALKSRLYFTRTSCPIIFADSVKNTEIVFKDNLSKENFSAIFASLRNTQKLSLSLKYIDSLEYLFEALKNANFFKLEHLNIIKPFWFKEQLQFCGTCCIIKHLQELVSSKNIKKFSLEISVKGIDDEIYFVNDIFEMSLKHPRKLFSVSFCSQTQIKTALPKNLSFTVQKY